MSGSCFEQPAPAWRITSFWPTSSTVPGPPVSAKEGELGGDVVCALGWFPPPQFCRAMLAGGAALPILGHVASGLLSIGGIVLFSRLLRARHGTRTSVDPSMALIDKQLSVRGLQVQVIPAPMTLCPRPIAVEHPVAAWSRFGRLPQQWGIPTCHGLCCWRSMSQSGMCPSALL